MTCFLQPMHGVVWSPPNKHKTPTVDINSSLKYVEVIQGPHVERKHSMSEVRLFGPIDGRDL
jgi:hypothetical protein